MSHRKHSLVARAATATIAVGFGAGLAVPLATGTAAAAPRAAAATTHYVAKGGSDTGSCTKGLPCKTLQYADSVSHPGDTILVEPGHYHQTVNITTPITLEGSGASKTTIDGANHDEGALGYFGVIGIATQTASGSITITGLTVTHPFVTSPEYKDQQSPTDIANFDTSSTTGNTVTVKDDVLGPAQKEKTYQGIGYYSLDTTAPALVEDNTAAGMYQAIFTEGAGARLTAEHNTLEHLAGTTSAGVTYPPQGIFQLADTTNTNPMTASHNTFTGYAGYGVASEAGYSGGNCSKNVCTGGVKARISDNSFSLGGTKGGAAAIGLYAGASDSLGARVFGNSGTVTAPTGALVVQSTSGTVNVAASNNTIKVLHPKKGSAGSLSGPPLLRR